VRGYIKSANSRLSDYQNDISFVALFKISKMSIFRGPHPQKYSMIYIYLDYIYRYIVGQ